MMEWFKFVLFYFNNITLFIDWDWHKVQLKMWIGKPKKYERNERNKTMYERQAHHIHRWKGFYHDVFLRQSGRCFGGMEWNGVGLGPHEYVNSFYLRLKACKCETIRIFLTSKGDLIFITQSAIGTKL